jgi:hypothetical protein
LAAAGVPERSIATKMRTAKEGGEVYISWELSRGTGKQHTLVGLGI